MLRLIKFFMFPVLIHLIIIGMLFSACLENMFLRTGYHCRIIAGGENFMLNHGPFRNIIIRSCSASAAHEDDCHDKGQSAGGTLNTSAILSAKGIISDISLGEALDNTSLTWETYGDSPWFGQDTTYFFGGSAAQSGAIGHNQSTTLSTTLTGPGELRFHWKVSSEKHYDWLEFYLNDTRLDRISGLVDWHEKVYQIPSGSNTIHWKYKKNYSISANLDTAWLDYVRFGTSLDDIVPAIICLEHPSVMGIWKWTYSPDESVYLYTDPASCKQKKADTSQWTWQELIQGLKAQKMLVGDISGDGLLEVVIHFDDDLLGYYSLAGRTWNIIIHNCLDFTLARTHPDGPQNVAFSIAQGVYLWNYAEGLVRLYTVPAEIINSGDLYRDGPDELLIGFSELPNLYVYSFATSSHTVIAGIKPSQMVTGDLTGDGYNELVCVFQGLGIYIFRNIGETRQEIHEVSDGLSIFNIIDDVPQNHKWVSGSKGWQVQRITYVEPMPAHSIALGNIAFTNAKELLFAFNNRTYYYSYGNGFHTLVFAPMKTIIAGRFTGKSKDDIIACMSQNNDLYLRVSSSGAWQLLINAGNANVMVTYAKKDTQYDIGTAKLPKTGQTHQYYYGDDGTYQMGIEWPSPRFTDHGNGTVTDDLTGLMWTKSANMAGTKNWNDAIDWCNKLVYGGHNDWRLPNIKELFSLIDISKSYPALPEDHPFTEVVFGKYWSSTTYAGDTESAWFLRIIVNTYILQDCKSTNNYVWAVRGTSTGTIHVHKTGQTHQYRYGDDGTYQMGAEWPETRFTDHGNGTVTDNLTGLMWTKDGDMEDNNNWWDAIDYCKSFYHAGYDDWRLPNIRELESLVDYSNFNPSMPSVHPFTGIVSSDYWSSSTYMFNTSDAWRVRMDDGFMCYRSKFYRYNVWPVRSGQ